MKVAFITEHFAPIIGGVAHSAARITRNLQAAGIDLSVFTVDINDEMVNPYVKHDTSFPFPVTRIGPFTSHKGNRPGALASERKHYYALLREMIIASKPDLLHCFYLLNPGFYGALLKQELGLPFLASVRGNDLSRDFFDFGRLAANQFVVQSADRITVVNDFLHDLFGQLFPMYTNKLVKIENSIGAIDQPEPITPIPELQGKLVLGTVGMIREKKGIQNLLLAYASLATTFPDIHLLLVGDVDKQTEREAYFKLISQLGLTGRLTITGQVDHAKVPAYLDCIDIFAMPSIDDGLANALLEAMQAGKPIVASDVFNRTLQPDVNCLMFPRHDVRALEQQLTRMIREPALRQALGVQAQYTASTRFVTRQETDGYIQLYNQILHP